MPLVGVPLQPRDIAELCFRQGWRDKELIMAVAVCLSESNGYPLAYNDNIAEDGVTVKSRDVGLFQINIPGEKVGQIGEERLYGIETNVARAWRMYKERQWDPWYGFLNGYATSTEWWYWSLKFEEWRPTGRFMHRAIRGVGNFWAGKCDVYPEPFLDYFIIPPQPLYPPDGLQGTAPFISWRKGDDHIETEGANWTWRGYRDDPAYGREAT